VQGARQVRERDLDALLIFVDAPSAGEQRARLEGRGDDPAQVARRLDVADDERAIASALGMTVVVNDDLDRATAEVAALIEAARARR
jgi:guanylate kinase